MQDDFHNNEGNLHELHAVKWYFTVEEEGDLDLLVDGATCGTSEVPSPFGTCQNQIPEPTKWSAA